MHLSHQMWQRKYIIECVLPIKIDNIPESVK